MRCAAACWKTWRYDRIHLVETLAATQKLGIDCTNLVEHLLKLAVIGEKRGDLGIGRIRYIAEAWAFAGAGDRGQVSLGSVPRSVDAMTTGSTTTLVGLDQRPAYDLARFNLKLEPTKTKLVAFGRFAQTNARSRGAQRPDTIYFLGFTLYCTQNQKGNFRVGMRTEKSRFRRSLARLRELMRMQRHLPIPDQAANLNRAIRGHYAYYGIAGNFEQCNGYIGPWSATGTECCAAGAAKATSHGMCSTRSRHGLQLCDRSCSFLTRSYSLSLCCEPTSEERSAGNLHATFCGSRGRATASGDPVGGVARRPPIPIFGTHLPFTVIWRDGWSRRRSRNCWKREGRAS